MNEKEFIIGIIKEIETSSIQSKFGIKWDDDLIHLKNILNKLEELDSLHQAYNELNQTNEELIKINNQLGKEKETLCNEITLLKNKIEQLKNMKEGK